MLVSNLATILVISPHNEGKILPSKRKFPINP